MKGEEEGSRKEMGGWLTRGSDASAAATKTRMQCDSDGGFRSCADPPRQFRRDGDSSRRIWVKTVCLTEKRFLSVMGLRMVFFCGRPVIGESPAVNYAVCTLRCKRQEEEDKWPEIESMKRERNFPAENEIVPRFFSMSGEEEEISLCLRSICCFCLFFSPE